MKDDVIYICEYYSLKYYTHKETATTYGSISLGRSYVQDCNLYLEDTFYGEIDPNKFFISSAFLLYLLKALKNA